MPVPGRNGLVPKSGLATPATPGCFWRVRAEFPRDVDCAYALQGVSATFRAAGLKSSSVLHEVSTGRYLGTAKNRGRSTCLVGLSVVPHTFLQLQHHQTASPSRQMPDVAAAI